MSISNSSSKSNMYIPLDSTQEDKRQCPFCQGIDVFSKYTLGDHSILRCRSCDFMWLHPQPSLEDLAGVYDSNYFQNDNFFNGKDLHIYGYYDYLAERFNKQEKYRLVVREAWQYLNPASSREPRLLDLGCGLGFLMDVAHDQGFQVAGIEFNASAVERMRNKYVFPVFEGDILEYVDDQPFDVITMMDVIEHVLEPIGTVQKAHRLLRPGGIFILTTMDCDSIVSRMLGTRLEDFRRVREHLYFFTKRTIRLLLEREGFEVLKIRYQGHTFRLDFLADRFRLVSPFIGKIFVALVRLLHMKEWHVNLNPMTKIIVFARRHGQ